MSFGTIQCFSLSCLPIEEVVLDVVDVKAGRRFHSIGHILRESMTNKTITDTQNQEWF